MAQKNVSLEKRMKEYEQVSRTFLTRRVPVMIRIDGKAFHSFTRGMKRPFDPLLRDTMEKTMKYLCQNIQGCVFGFTQSDEITLVLTDYATISTDAWFSYNVQKMSSVAASMATSAFNRYFYEAVSSQMEFPDAWNDDLEYLCKLESKYFQAMFDARAFSIPKEEVCNNLIWRQQDATRNSIASVGQSYFSQKELQGKTRNQIQEMLFTNKGVNWNDFATRYKRGSCCYRETKKEEMEDPRMPGKQIQVERRVWVIDSNPPIFSQDRNFIEKWI